MHPGVASAALLGLIFYRLVVEVTLVAHYIVIEEVACAYTHPQRVEAVGVIDDVGEVGVDYFGGEICAVGFEPAEFVGA